MTKTRQPISDRRRAVFLATLAKTGSMTAAAAAATPWAVGRKCGLESFRDLSKRDPAFAVEVEEARAAALGRVEQAIAERAVEGVDEPVYQKGARCGLRKVYSDTLLLRLAARLAPESWSERQRTELSGSVGVVASRSDGFLSISASDVLLLSEDKQQQLAELVEEVGRLKERDDGRAIQKLPVPAAAGDGGPARE
jgi:hypothetical protein